MPGSPISHAPRPLNSTSLFNAATTGTHTLKRDDIGRLAVGCRADMVLVDMAASDPRSARSLIYAAGARATRSVFVDE